MRISLMKLLFGFRPSLQVGLVFLAALVFLPSLVSLSLVAQDDGSSGDATLPSGWQEMSASDFINASVSLFSSGGVSQDFKREVTGHAWGTFLDRNDFVSGEDWSVVEGMLDLYLARRQILVVGENEEQVAASRAALEQRFQTLTERIRARLEANPGLLSGSSFDELKEAEKSLRKILSKAERAQLFLNWMEANNWEILPLADHLFLLGKLDVGQIADGKFSVRWTGDLRPVASEAFVFEQLRQHDIDGVMRVSIDGSLVLNTANGQEDEGVYRSQPVSLTAGAAVPIEVEFVYDQATMASSNMIYRDRCFPMAVLQWESESIEQQIIPGSAFTPPAGFADAGANGLKGEYFQNLDLSDLVVARLDPGLQMIWHHAAVCSANVEQQDGIVNSCLAAITTNGALTNLDVSEQRNVVQKMIPKLGNRLCCSQRVELLEYISSQPALLADLRPAALLNMIDFSYVLPVESHLQLLKKWGELRDPQACRPGIYPGWGKDHYNTLNHDGMGKIGHFFWDSEWENAVWLCESCLESEDGGANVSTAYILAFASRFENKEQWFKSHLDEILADDSLTGDRRAGWLLARAFAAEVAVSEIPRPANALPFLEDAFLTAESNEMKFRIFQEQISRLFSLDQSTAATTLINQFGDQFSAVDQRAEINAIEAKGAELRQYYEQVRVDSVANQTRPNAAFIAALEARLASAIARGDDATAERYQRRLDALNGNSDE